MAKSSHSQLFSRYIWLTELIYRREKVSFKDISKAWEHAFHLNETGEPFPPRTFDYHRNAIEEMFSIKINCEKHAPYRYYIENREDVTSNYLQKWLIETFSVNQLINENKGLNRRILFEETPSGQECLIPIIEAMRDGKMMEMTYHSFWQDQERTFMIKPYCLKLFYQRWYCVAHSSYRDRVRIYALDRMHDLKTLTTEYTLPEDFDGEAYFCNTFGVSHGDDSMAEHILVKVTKHQVPYFKSLPLHHSQKEVKIHDEYSLFSYFLYPNYEFTQELLSRGANIEVVAPESLRKEMIRTINMMKAQYSQS